MIILNSLNEIEKRLGIEDDGPAQKFLVATAQKYMDKFVPFRPGSGGGHLRTIIHMDSHSITYMSPYAGYQYYGERKDGSHKVQHYTTPGTGKYWDQRMLSVYDDLLTQQVSKYIGKTSKG